MALPLLLGLELGMIVPDKCTSSTRILSPSLFDRLRLLLRTAVVFDKTLSV